MARANIPGINFIWGVDPSSPSDDRSCRWFSIRILTGKLRDFDPFQLAAISDLVTISGSLVLGLAVACHKIKVAVAWEKARIDEIWQVEQWGVDDEAASAAEKRRESFLMAEEFLRSVEN